MMSKKKMSDDAFTFMCIMWAGVAVAVVLVVGKIVGA